MPVLPLNDDTARFVVGSFLNFVRHQNRIEREEPIGEPTFIEVGREPSDELIADLVTSFLELDPAINEAIEANAD